MPKKQAKWGFVVNPKAGDGKAKKAVSLIERLAREKKLNFDIRYTLERGHAGILAAQYVFEGFTHIISVGGDGTHNEAIQNIVGADVIFGLVSAGSGNDIPPILGFSENFLAKDWEAMFEAKHIDIDLGRCNERYFLNAIGAGYDAYVAHDMERMSKKWKRLKIHYYTSVLKNLLHLKPAVATVTCEGVTETIKTILTSIGIGRRVGGGFHLTPHAIANDGYFDVCIAEFLSLPRRTALLLEVINKNHSNHGHVRYFKTKNIVLEFDKDMKCHIDGELFSDTRLDVRLVAEKIKIIYNPNMYNYFNAQPTV